MADYMKKLHGERLKKMMQDGIRASRFTRLSKNFSPNMLNKSKQEGSVVREPSFLGHLTRNNNFDYLGLRDETNKLYKKVSVFLEKNGENKHALSIFTDYMYKINSHYSKNKRLLIVTETKIYSAHLNLSLVVRIPIKGLQKVTLIKNSSAVMVLHAEGTTKDLIMETMKRTELIVYLIN